MRVKHIIPEYLLIVVFHLPKIDFVFYYRIASMAQIPKGLGYIKSVPFFLKIGSFVSGLIGHSGILVFFNTNIQFLG
jgi:hypothetical protein